VRAAVLGSPIAHSLSPALHRAAYRWLGLDWTYDAVECTETELPALLARCSAAGDWAGLSLTMPLKTAALGLVDTVDRAAELTAAVNTVVFAAGRRAGSNTDVPGLVATLAERGVRSPRSVAVLGGGATARSTVAALGEMGVAEATAYVRRPEASADLVETGRRCGVTVRLAPWAEAAGGLGADLVVSTAPSGAADLLADSVPDRPAALLDVVYLPWPTPLARAWREAGGVVVGGLDLLVHQAALQVQAMTGCDASAAELVAVMRPAGEAALAAG
jgi:shikimate dehydrogenase